MNKLTSQEILDIISKNMSVEEFGYGDYPIPKDIDVNEGEIEILKYNKELALTQYQNHPGYNFSDKRDEEYEQLKKEYQNSPTEYTYRTDKWLSSLGLGKIEEVDQYGGEGQGSTWYSIKYFEDHDVYIKTSGYYSSYHGTDFDYGYGEEVRPTEKTITVYE